MFSSASRTCRTRRTRSPRITAARTAESTRKLLEQWDEHVDTILINLDRMVDELNGTLREHGLVQGSSNDAIDAEYSRSTQVFDELNGTNTASN
ncbi:hypothetical protein GCM10023238_14500 [Streptomyces heliomycini]